MGLVGGEALSVGDEEASDPVAGTRLAPTLPTSVVVVHDYLTQRGGAERVVLAMLKAFPEARLLTTVYNPETTFPAFRRYRVETVPLPARRLLERRHRLGLPLYGTIFRRHAVEGDVVLCSTSGFAHLVGTDAPKVVYCHNTPRWLYQEQEYLPGRRGVEWLALRAFERKLRRDDRAGADSASRYITNSRAVARRVRAAYGIEPSVIHPPYGMSPGGLIDPVPGVPEEFLLLVARGRHYKNVALALPAVERARKTVVVVGAIPTTAEPSGYVVPVGSVTEAQLRWLYSRCRGVLAVASEDFGLTPVEGHAFGKPTLALRRGGYLESVVEGLNGSFIDDLEADTVTEALLAFDPDAFDAAVIMKSAERFGEDRFAEQLAAVVDEVVRSSPSSGEPAR